MKLILILALISFSALAKEHEGKHNKELSPEQLAKIKEHAVANIDKRITILNEAKSCISGASSQEALKQCRMNQKESMKNIMKDMKTHRSEMKAQRKEMRGPRGGKGKNDQE